MRSLNGKPRELKIVKYWSLLSVVKKICFWHKTYFMKIICLDKIDYIDTIKK